MVTAITNRLIEEFEEELILSYKVQDVQEALASRSVYQRIMTVDKRMRYRLDLVVKDVNSGHVGVVRTAIAPSSYGLQELSASSLILSDMIIPLSRVPARDEMLFWEISRCDPASVIFSRRKTTWGFTYSCTI